MYYTAMIARVGEYAVMQDLYHQRQEIPWIQGPWRSAVLSVVSVLKILLHGRSSAYHACAVPRASILEGSGTKDHGEHNGMAFGARIFKYGAYEPCRVVSSLKFSLSSAACIWHS